MAGKSRRGKVLLEPYKQLRFGMVFIGLNLLFSLLMTGVFSYFMYDMFAAISSYFRLSGAESAMTMEKFMTPLGVSLGIFLAFIVSTLVLSARYTHQFYGPMVSIKRFLDQIIEGGRPAPIKLRANDQLQDLVSRLNTIASLDRQIVNQRSLSEILRFLDDLIAGRKPAPLTTGKEDPLEPIATKLNNLPM